MRSVLIVKMSSIGDVVHALPVASALRRRYPSLRISWAVEEWTAPLVVGHPAVDRVVVFPTMRWPRERRRWVSSFRTASRELQAESYDVAVDLQGLLKTSVVALLSRARTRIGTQYCQAEGASLVSRAVPGRPGRRHVVEDHLECAQFLGAPPAPVSFDLPVQAEAAASVTSRLSGLRVPPHAPLIVINPSASVLTRTWPIGRWARVAGALAEAGTVVLVGDHSQMARHAALAGRASRQPHDLTGRTTLAELVALLDRCTIHIAPDTGSAHIAAALGRPVVALYGPTPPWRKAPFGQSHRHVYHDGLCGVTCPQFCFRRRRCLQAATPGELVERARLALDGAGLRIGQQ